MCHLYEKEALQKQSQLQLMPLETYLPAGINMAADSAWCLKDCPGGSCAVCPVCSTRRPAPEHIWICQQGHSRQHGKGCIPASCSAVSPGIINHWHRLHLCLDDGQSQERRSQGMLHSTSEYASKATADNMAKAAYQQAAQLSRLGSSIIGIG